MGRIWYPQPFTINEGQRGLVGQSHKRNCKFLVASRKQGECKSALPIAAISESWLYSHFVESHSTVFSNKEISTDSHSIYNMGSGMSVEKTVGLTTGNMDVKNKISHDVKKLTNAAAKLKMSSKKKQQADKEKDQRTPNNKQEVEVKAVPEAEKRLPSKKELILESRSSSKPTSSSTTVSQPKRWTLTELLNCLGTYVHRQCKDLISRPTPPEVAMWVRCTDKALHLNGWTINSFLFESHVVFTYMLLQKAFEKFEVRTLTDAKEIVLMCLYISYTYNANEISYPLRPFLVKQDRVSFWNKCTELSLSSSSEMLNLNRDRSYYRELLQDLRSFSVTYTLH